MAAQKQGSPNLEFAVAQLKKNPKLEFGKLKAAADKKGLKMMPIIFGRAKLALGLSKAGSSKRGRKASRAASSGTARGGSSRNGSNGNGSTINGIQQLVDAVRRTEALQQALQEIRTILDNVETPRRGPGRPRGRRAA